jgi:hypothetical protein
VAEICGTGYSSSSWLAGGAGEKFYTGFFYGEAGMLLRMLQTDSFQPAPRAELLTVTNTWPFAEMPIQ